MLKNLQISGFRTFRSLKVEPLSRVNLFVGANNAGKTSVLEAIETLMSGIDGLVRGLLRREEVSFESQATPAETTIEIAHVFHEHHLPEPGVGLSIEGESDFLGTHSFTFIRDTRGTNTFNERDGFRVDDGSPEEDWVDLLPTGDIGVPRLMQARLKVNGFFLDSGGLKSSELRAQWDGIVLTSEEEKVLDAMRIIESRAERIAFSSDRQSASNIFVKLQGEGGRIPLGSMGEGMRRLLTLAMGLASAKHSLLIDDIDTGLHHSVMIRMWRLIAETAKRLNIQVFATTHSLDCVRALGWLYEEAPELASEVTVHRVEKGADVTTVYSAEELQIAARQRMEIR